MASKHKAGSVNSNILKGSNPLFLAIPLTKIFVEVPIKVQVPPNNAEKEIGINNLEGFMPVSLQTSKAIGINMATTAVSFINAENKAAEKQKIMRAKT